MSSIFSRIISGEIPCYKIAEDASFLAFLDINPLVEGHALVIPKKEIDYIFDIDDALLKDMIVFSKKVASRIQKAIPCKRIGLSIIGLEVPHAHIHLVPMQSMKDMNFSNVKLVLSSSQFEVVQTKINAISE
ncbi:MAG: HIT family protein [Crocinitomicaceae bacterium]